VQVLFATLDPERDQLERLTSYVNAFRPSGGRPMLGLRGDAAQTAALVRQLHLVAEKWPAAAMGYTLDHTAGVFLFDRSGTLVGFSPYGQPLAKLARDFATLLAEPFPVLR
jgi:protein SCO1/2